MPLKKPLKIIEKNKKIGIKKIEIEGNTTIPDWKLKLAMKDTKQRSILRIFKRSKFTESTYEKDKLAILEKFNAIGYRDATIKMDTVYKLDEKNLIIQLSIDEGNKYYFGNIEWIGNSKFKTSYLDTVLGIKRGDVFNKSLLDQRLNSSQDGRDITSIYMDRGYLFFRVVPVETNVSNNYINYQMRVMEGKEARVNRIIIKGNTKSQKTFSFIR